MKACESINCNSCGGPVKLYSRDYGNCEYCGNTNRVLSNGKTEILKRETKIESINTKPTNATGPTPAKFTKMDLFFLIFCGVILGVGLLYFIKRRKENHPKIITTALEN